MHRLIAKLKANDPANITANVIKKIIMLCSASVPAMLGKGQGAKEIGHNLARERPKFGHNLVRKRH